MKPDKTEQNIALIGMPAAGKSTLGGCLAAALSFEFVDTDRLIEDFTGEPLQSTLARLGYQQLREIEQRIILDMVFSCSVIATGGSAVYGELAMLKLKQCARILYLRVSPETLLQRIDNWQTRGIACTPGQSLASLYAEREPLYQRYADEVIDCESQSIEQTKKSILALLS